MNNGVRKFVLLAVFLFTLVLGLSLHPPTGRAPHTDWQVQLRFAVFGFAACLGVSQLRHLRAPASIIVPLAYGALAALSVVYSVGPLNSIVQAFVLFSVFAVVGLVITYCRHGNRVLGVWLAYLWALYVKIFVSLVAYFAGFDFMVMEARSHVAIRPMFNLRRLAGVMGSPNSLGYTAALATLLSVVLLQAWPSLKYKRLYWAGTAASIITLIGTQSRTAILGLIAGLLAVVFARNRAKGVLLALGAVVAVCFALYVIPDTTMAVVTRGGEEGQVLSTLQGRTVIWEYVWHLFREAPWLGYGYGASRVVLPAQYGLSRFHAVTHAHNMVMESLLTLGVVGTVFLIWVVGLAIFKHWKVVIRPDRGPVRGCLPGWGIVWLAMVAAVAEPSIAISQSAITLGFYLALGIALVADKGRLEGIPAEVALEVNTRED